MKPLAKWGPVLFSLVLMALAIWLEWSMLGERGSLLLFSFLNLILFVDFFDFIVRLPLRHTEGRRVRGASGAAPLDQQDKGDLLPYAIVASLYNAEGELDELLPRLRPFQQNVWFVDDASSDRTAAHLRQRGWRCLEVSPNKKKPAALRQLVAQLPAEVETVLVIDPDIYFDAEQPVAALEKTIQHFQVSDGAALSPRLLVDGSSALERYQSFEYCLTFELTRQSLPGCSATSGIALYRRAALERTFETHSLSVYAEDLENAMILISSGERIDYDRRLVMHTEAPKRWRSWFSQRVGWSFGLIRAYHLCWPALRRLKLVSASAYQYLIYLGLFCLLFHPLKLLSGGLLLASLLFSLAAPWFEGALSDAALTTQVSVAGVYVRYTLLVFLAWLFIVPASEKRRMLAVIPTYFFYVCVLLIPTTAGYCNWYSLRFLGRRVYRDHYQEESALRCQFYRSVAPETL